MAGALRKTMVYLGLSEEDQRQERYDEYDAYGWPGGGDGPAGGGPAASQSSP